MTVSLATLAASNGDIVEFDNRHHAIPTVVAAQRDRRLRERSPAVTFADAVAGLSMIPGTETTGAIAWDTIPVAFIDVTTTIRYLSTSAATSV